MPRLPTGEVTFEIGADPTFDAPAPKATASRAVGSTSKLETQRKVGATLENYSRHLSEGVAAGEITPAQAQAKLKRAAGVLPER